MNDSYMTDHYSYDRYGDYIDESEDSRKKYDIKNQTLMYTGLFIGSGILISAFAVIPRMISVFPRQLIFSIILCLLAFAGYTAVLIFFCNKMLKRVKAADFIKIAYTAYAVPFILSWILIGCAEIGRRLAPDAGWVDFIQNMIVWCMAHMRFLRMFGINNVYSVLASHIIFIGAITFTYYLHQRKIDAQKGKITKIKTKKINRKNKGSEKNRRKRTKMKNIFSMTGKKKKKKSRPKAKFGRRRKQSIGVFLNKITKKSKHRHL